MLLKSVGFITCSSQHFCNKSAKFLGRIKEELLGGLRHSVCIPDSTVCLLFKPVAMEIITILICFIRLFIRWDLEKTLTASALAETKEAICCNLVLPYLVQFRNSWQHADHSQTEIENLSSTFDYFLFLPFIPCCFYGKSIRILGTT